MLRHAAGGDPVAEVVLSAGPAGRPSKDLGAVKYEDLLVEVPLSEAARPLLDLLSEPGARGAKAREGSLFMVNQAGAKLSELALEGAALSEVVLPEWDASAKEAANLQFRFKVVSSKRMAGGGVLAIPLGRAAKQTNRSNFRLKLGDLETSKVSRVAAVSVLIGEDTQDPRRFDVEVASTGMKGWMEWFQAGLAAGHTAPKLDGVIEVLAANLRDVLGEVKLDGVGICRLAPSEAGEETIQRWKATLFCDQLSLRWK